MLATQQLQELVQNTKVSKALAGNLLPSDGNSSILNLENLKTVTVVEEGPNGSVPAAIGVFNVITPNQYYCSAVATSGRYNDVFVNIEPVETEANELGVEEDVADNHTVYKISEVKEELKDLSGFPQYFSVFGKPEATPLLQTVVDQLIDNVGQKNFDMKKNISVDLYLDSKQNDESVNLWRDKTGFVVVDKYRFVEFEVPRTKLVSLLESSKQATDIKYETLTPRSAVLFLDYDSNISMIDRQEYLEFVFGLRSVKGTVAIDAENQPVGYVLSLNGRVLQLYGESEEIAVSLLLEHLKDLPSESVTFFTVSNNHLFQKVSEIATSEKRVARYHTRILPSNVKWSNVFFVNMGLHLY
ncbi:unnamed protein product [Bursaphelenchus okinawaensis]|uniref:DUF7596 domain-containing protein n=1 Tax=Bursaphelenchus okinawaensis TaxID=465554 RepID=A0A811KI28_9BILA|nr:unnamed protein product [Bursaphelenchus okinawaensis]CAG9103624.1 unnamed protein product [Bursaphelenchus okinawaensis]